MRQIFFFLLVTLILVVPCLGQKINITSPNGGENLLLGSRYTINWNSSGITAGKFTVLLFNGSSKVGIIKSGIKCSNGNHSYSWEVGKLLGNAQVGAGNNYTVKVRQAGKAPKDYSDATFTISIKQAPPKMTLDLISPNGGEKWELGTEQTITWKQSGINYDHFEISLWDGNKKLGKLYQDIPLSMNSLSWTVGHLYKTPSAGVGTNYKIRILWSNTLYDFSDKPFSIVQTLPTSIAVVKPGLNQIWTPGVDEEVAWKKTGLMDKFVSIDLMDITKKTVKKVISNRAYNGGSFHLRDTGRLSDVLSNIPSGKYIIRICTLDKKVCGFSEIFEIKVKSNPPSNNGIVQLDPRTLVKNLTAPVDKSLMIPNKAMVLGPKSVKPTGSPEILKFEANPQLIEAGKSTTFNIKYKNATSVLLYDNNKNVVLRGFYVKPDWEGTCKIQIPSTPALYEFKLEVKNNTLKDTQYFRVDALYNNPGSRPKIEEFYPDPKTVSNPNDYVNLHYKYTRGIKGAKIVNLESGKIYNLPTGKNDISGTLKVMVPFQMRYGLYVENKYGFAEKVDLVNVKNHPGSSVKKFEAKRQWGSGKVEIEYEVWGAIRVEILRKRSLNDPSKVSLKTITGKDPLKGKFIDDPSYLPVMYELRAKFSGSTTAIRNQTVKR